MLSVLAPHNLQSLNRYEKYLFVHDAVVLEVLRKCERHSLSHPTEDDRGTRDSAGRIGRAHGRARSELWPISGSVFLVDPRPRAPRRHADCSDCFRLERLPGGVCTHWKAPPLHGARHNRSLVGQAGREHAVVRSKRIRDPLPETTSNSCQHKHRGCNDYRGRAGFCTGAGLLANTHPLPLANFLEHLEAILAVSGERL